MKHASTAAWSFGTKTTAEPKTTIHFTPGVGSYDLRQQPGKQIPAPSFGTSVRTNLAQAENTPGPGNYNISSFLDPKSHSDSKHKSVKTRENEKKEDAKKTKIETPGPGSYNPQKPSRNYNYSMGNKTFGLAGERSNSQIGPGQYDPSHPAWAASTYSIGKGRREELKKSTAVPGPGTYDQRSQSEAPQYRFGTGSRTKRGHNEEIPGPGSYEIPDLVAELKNKMAKTIVPRRALPANHSDAPGPGAYQPRIASSTPSFSIGNGNRSNFVKAKSIPAPWDYNPSNPSHTTRNPKIGTGYRPPISRTNAVPGPGEYDVKTMSPTAPQFSITGRKPDVKFNMITPGPGAYEPEYIQAKESAPAHVIGTGTRSNEVRLRPKTMPGPGQYELRGRAEGPTWSFGKDLRSKQVNDNEPGPGYYEIPATIPDVPKYLLSHTQEGSELKL